MALRRRDICYSSHNHDRGAAKRVRIFVHYSAELLRDFLASNHIDGNVSPIAGFVGRITFYGSARTAVSYGRIPLKQ